MVDATGTKLRGKKRAKVRASPGVKGYNIITGAPYTRRKHLRRLQSILPRPEIWKDWPMKAKELLITYANTGVKGMALELVGARYNQLGRWLNGTKRSDALPGFKRAWARANALSVDLMEAELYNRAMFGTEEEVWYKGERVGMKNGRPSDLLLIFALRGAKPDKYTEKGIMEHTGDILGIKELAKIAKGMRDASETAVIPRVADVTVVGKEIEDAS